MELQLQYGPGPVRVTVEGPADSAEVQRIVSLLQAGSQRLWALDEQERTTALTVDAILWAETVDDRVFLYTADAMYRSPCSLAALELLGEGAGLFRCGKSTVVNLNGVRTLCSRPGGRIEATLETGEKLIISRRYAPALREKLLGG